MKKFLAATMVLFSAATFANTAEQTTTGGFQGPSSNRYEMTVKQALDLSDDDKVSLTGYITESLGDEKYTFKDETASIVIDIDNDDWNGLTVTPDMKVNIQGEIDKDLMREYKVDVDVINVVK